jgi:hypothetical protein
MKDRGKFWWKERWICICSVHGGYHDENCKACNTGWWHNVWMLHISGFIFDITPRLWIWWVNKKWKK